MILKIDPLRRDILNDNSRHKIICAGRRFGKTYLALTFLLSDEIHPYEKRYFIAPTYKQGKIIAWDLLKRLFNEMGIFAKINETELRITLPNKSEFRIMGADREDGLRGTSLTKVVLDEYAYMKPHVFHEVVLPMLSDTGGKALICGTPSGYDHFYRLYNNAQLNDNWKAWQFRTIDGGNVPPEEIEIAKQEMDERSFRQEFEASFETYQGALYYNFDNKNNIQNLNPDANQPLIISADFNKSPMVWLVCQIDGDTLKIIKEISNPVNAKTEQSAYDFVKLFETFQNKTVYLTGDASNNYETHRDFTTDYIMIKDIITNHGWRVVVNVPAKNPSINNRINVVCSLIGHKKLIVDESCNYLINDLKVNQSDGKGGKDKSDPNQTHASDCLDYVVWQYFANKFYKNKVKRL